MKRILILLLALLLAVCLLGCSNAKVTGLKTGTYKDPAPSSVISTETWGYIPVNQLIIVFRDEVNKKVAAKTLSQIDGQVVGELPLMNLYQLEMDFITEAELTAAMDTAREMEGVELVFPNVVTYSKDIEGKACSPLKDPVFEDPVNSSHYNTIGMENAWKIIKGSGVELNKVTVGILDSAIYNGSDEFKGKIKITGDTTDEPAKNNSDQIIHDGLNHGTMVTHVIGADPENSGMVGVASVLGENLSIDVKNLYDESDDCKLTTIDEEDITQASVTEDGVDYTYSLKGLVYLNQQVKSGATVINCSFGPEKPDDNYGWIAKAYEKFFKKIQETNPNVVFVAAAGNEGSADKSKGALNGKNYFPGGLNLPNIITVGALENDGQRADFSNFAEGDAEVTLSAPGVKMVLGVDKDGKPIKASGTSFAAPQVTAAIALVQSINPKLTADQIKKILVETAAKGVTTTDNLQSIPIPEGMGSGVLRVDEVILKTINDLRIENGQVPFTLEQLLNNCAVTLIASGGPLEYKITAHIPAALGKSTDIKLEVLDGEYALSGDSTQNVSVGSEAMWNLSLVKDSVFVRATRLDNGGCAYATLKQEMNVSGLYKGTRTYTKAKNDLLGTVEDMELRFVQNDNGTATIIVDDASIEGTYDPSTGEFELDYVFFWHLTFSLEEGTIVAKGTMTTDNMGEGFTQEIVLDLQRTGD